ncbi:hypothetical protein STPH1_7489 [Streptomyces sp. OM5714]|nr:hypothetical protein STPH1_7484 [Streptomyces sp. OM5714]KAF2775302.1 hypothetical protein STPH1_7489 [Streptomyces sp. OM5714]
MKESTGDRRAPRYKPTLVAPYRDHLRRRRAEDPAVPVTHLLREIKDLGYIGSANLLVRYLTQGRAEGERPVTTPQRFACLLLTRPENLRDKDTALLRELTESCPEMTELAKHTGEFAKLLTPAEGNDANLTHWITAVRAATLPHCTPSPTVSNSTAPPWMPASACPTTTAVPRASTPEPCGS